MAWPSGIIVSLCKVYWTKQTAAFTIKEPRVRKYSASVILSMPTQRMEKTLPLRFCILSETPTPTKFQVSSLSLYPSFTTDTSATHVPINMLSKQTEG